MGGSVRGGVLVVLLWCWCLCSAPSVIAEDLLARQHVTGSFQTPTVAVYKKATDEAWFISENQATTLVVYSFANKTTRTVQTSGASPFATHDAAGGIVGNKIYHFGGRFASSAFVLDTDNLVWSTRANIPVSSTYGHAVLTIEDQNRVFLYGGFAFPNYFNSLYEYLPATNSWVDRGNYGVGVTFTYGIPMGQNLFLHGGEPNTNQLLRFNTASNSWSTVQPTSTLAQRRFHTMVADQSSLSIWIVGGLVTGGTTIHHRVRFHTSSDLNPDVDNFSGSLPCTEYYLVHEPSAKTFCLGTAILKAI
ncbi:hypothetical protein QOT17_011783 [Balamuthia mandrillaris]